MDWNEKITLTRAQIKELMTWAYWEGVEGGRGVPDDFHDEYIIAQINNTMKEISL